MPSKDELLSSIPSTRNVLKRCSLEEVCREVCSRPVWESSGGKPPSCWASHSPTFSFLAIRLSSINTPISRIGQREACLVGAGWPLQSWSASPLGPLPKSTEYLWPGPVRVWWILYVCLSKCVRYIMVRFILGVGACTWHILALSIPVPPVRAPSSSGSPPIHKSSISIFYFIFNPLAHPPFLILPIWEKSPYFCYLLFCSLYFGYFIWEKLCNVKSELGLGL